MKRQWLAEKEKQKVVTESLMLGIKIVGITFLFAWLFYDSPVGLLWGVGVTFFLFRDWQKEQIRKRQYELEKQFQTGLVFAAASLEAGYSVENAWKEMEKEVTRLYGEQAVFVKMLHQINQRMKVNEPMEMLIWEMGQQSSSDTIRNFAEVFFFARKSGGNMTSIMRRTANRISQNFQVQEEIQLALSSKQLELMIMHVMPFGILGYLRFGSADFLNPLYHNLAGVLVMTGCVVLYGIAWWMSKKIIQIGV